MHLIVSLTNLKCFVLLAVANFNPMICYYIALCYYTLICFKSDPFADLLHFSKCNEDQISNSAQIVQSVHHKNVAHPNYLTADHECQQHKHIQIQIFYYVNHARSTSLTNEQTQIQ